MSNIVKELEHVPQWNFLLNELKKITNRMDESEFINLDNNDFANLVKNEPVIQNLAIDLVSALLMKQWYSEVRKETEAWLKGYENE